MKNKKRCPVCGKYTFEEVNVFEDCPICGWTDDAVQEIYPDMTGANIVSLNKARELYEQKGKVN